MAAHGGIASRAALWFDLSHIRRAAGVGGQFGAGNAVSTAVRLEPARIEQAIGIDAALKGNIAFAISILPTERTFGAWESDTLAPAPYINRTRSAICSGRS
jgi:hypothetical protein